jgi:hypothetical protein
MEYIHKAKAERNRTKVLTDQMEARRTKNKVPCLLSLFARSRRADSDSARPLVRVALPVLRRSARLSSRSSTRRRRSERARFVVSLTWSPCMYYAPQHAIVCYLSSQSTALPHVRTRYLDLSEVRGVPRSRRTNTDRCLTSDVHLLQPSARSSHVSSTRDRRLSSPLSSLAPSAPSRPPSPCLMRAWVARSLTDATTTEWHLCFSQVDLHVSPCSSNASSPDLVQTPKLSAELLDVDDEPFSVRTKLTCFCAPFAACVFNDLPCSARSRLY